jgi:hypothetical protein
VNAYKQPVVYSELKGLRSKVCEPLTPLLCFLIVARRHAFVVERTATSGHHSKSERVKEYRIRTNSKRPLQFMDIALCVCVRVCAPCVEWLAVLAVSHSPALNIVSELFPAPGIRAYSTCNSVDAECTLVDAECTLVIAECTLIDA